MDIPPVVRDYLAREDSLARAQLVSAHLEVKEQLGNPATRRAIIKWLAADEARRPEMTGLVAGSLGFLRAEAEPGEAMVVRPFTLHPEPIVRLRAFEFLLTLYFPDRNREALLMVLQSMLVDSHDAVRTQGVRYLERADAGAELGTFLAGWAREAPGKGWHTGESAELVEWLLAEDGG